MAKQDEVTPESEPMTESEALEYAVLALADARGVLVHSGWYRGCVEAATVLQSLREQLERERAFVEAAKAASMYMDGIFTHPDDRLGAQQGDLLMFQMLDAYRALTAPPEGK